MFQIIYIISSIIEKFVFISILEYFFYYSKTPLFDLFKYLFFYDLNVIILKENYGATDEFMKNT